MVQSGKSSMPKVEREVFGRLSDGTAIEMVRLRGDNGFEVRLIGYGAALQSIFVPDRAGRVADVVLGRDDLAGYLAVRRFLGATIGRYANRIANGAFELDGQRFQLPTNDDANALHGGPAGFDRRRWTITAIGESPAPFVTLSYVSADGEEGYPGRLQTEPYLPYFRRHRTFGRFGGDDRQADRRQSDQSQLLQSRRRRGRQRYSGPSSSRLSLIPICRSARRVFPWVRRTQSMRRRLISAKPIVSAPAFATVVSRLRSARATITISACAAASRANRDWPPVSKTHGPAVFSSSDQSARRAILFRQLAGRNRDWQIRPRSPPA